MDMGENEIVWRDSNIYKKHLDEWSDDKLINQKFRVDKELKEAQEEYFDVNTKIETKMDLQFVCNHLINLSRALNFQMTRRQLEKAFTPRIKKMLDDSVNQQIDS
jgi:alpha-amylase/alpha-mannosidase (GH57 family)